MIHLFPPSWWKQTGACHCGTGIVFFVSSMPMKAGVHTPDLVQWTSLANDNAWNVTVTDHGHPVLARVMSYGVGICLCWPGPAWGIRLRCTCWNTAGSVIPNRHLNSLSQPGLGGRKPGFKLWLLYTQAYQLTFWVTLSVTAGKHKYQLSNILRVRFNELIVSWIYKLFTEKQT